VTGRSDEVEKGVNTVVAEAGVTLDTALFSENIVVLALEVAHDLAETVAIPSSVPPHHEGDRDGAYVNSLSIWSPKPGVSTTVREMRTPSSSSSASATSSALS
jgi:hypothetical protein